MITVDAGQLAQFNATVSGATLLFDVEFASGTQYLTTYVTPIVANGHTYTALGQLLQVSAFRESEVLSMDKLTVSLSLVNNAMLAAAIGPASEYRNRAIRIYLQLLNDKWVPVENPILRWSGIMDKMRISRSPSKTGKSSGTIEMICQRSGLSRFRNSVGLRMNHAQQQIDYPGDLGFEYTDELVKNPPVWLSKKFQEVTK